MNTVTKETISEDDAELEKKIVKHKISEENNNTEHVILNYMTQMVKLFMCVGIRIVLVQKRT